MWYSEFHDRAKAGRPKLVAEYSANLANGTKKSWWSSGGRRSEGQFDNGVLVRVRAWSPAGETLPESSALALAREDAEADASYYESLEGEIDAYPPDCANSTAQ